MKYVHYGLGLVVMIILSSCGGGDSEIGALAQTIPTSTAGDVAHRINAARAQSQVCEGQGSYQQGDALAWNDALAAAARKQAEDIVTSERLAIVGANSTVHPNCDNADLNPLRDPHCHSDGSNVAERALDEGFSYPRAVQIGEIMALTENDTIDISNLDAASFNTPQAVVDAWLASPAHCGEMLRSQHRLVGVHVLEASSNTKLWVTVFAGED